MSCIVMSSKSIILAPPDLFSLIAASGLSAAIEDSCKKAYKSHKSPHVVHSINQVMNRVVGYEEALEHEEDTRARLD